MSVPPDRAISPGDEGPTFAALAGEGPWTRLARGVAPLVRYLALSTETHAYCGALAFFALVAFYPFSSLLLVLSKHVLGSTAGHAVVVEALREYYPEGQAFLLRNLEVSVAEQGRTLQVHSVLWILVGAAGFFIPLETAFNRVWGARAHRPYWKNQLVGLLLTAGACLLALVFVLLTASARQALLHVAGAPAARALRQAVLHAGAVAFSITAVFLFYRFLPNAKVRAREVWPAAVLAGVVAEAVWAAYLVALPFLRLPRSQGPYYISISFALLAYVEAFVVLGGAFLAAAPRGAPAAGPEDLSWARPSSGDSDVGPTRAG